MYLRSYLLVHLNWYLYRIILFELVCTGLELEFSKLIDLISLKKKTKQKSILDLIF